MDVRKSLCKQFRKARLSLNDLIVCCTLLSVILVIFYEKNVVPPIANGVMIRDVGERQLAAFSLQAAAQMSSKSSDTINSTQANSTEKQRPKPWCPDPPIVSPENASFPLDLTSVTYQELVEQYGHLMEKGGHFEPPTCRSREHVALIIPYRDREHNLHVLLNNLLPFLMRQQLEFTVFLTEQTAEHPFNKGLIFNVAYKYSLQTGANFTCFIMQDTDLIPMDNRNLYRCADQPRHLVLTTGQTEWKNRLRYKTSFGGAIALRKKHMEEANGFSVTYYGWGYEDDDLYIRLRKKRYQVVRYPILIGKYYEMRHKKQGRNPQLKKLRKTAPQWLKNNGLDSMNFTLVHEEQKELYTWLLIQVPPPPASIYGGDTGKQAQKTKNKKAHLPKQRNP